MDDPFACPDPLAERRYAYGQAAAGDADWRVAAELLEQALERAPAWPPALFALAEAREHLGDERAAAAAYRATLAADAQDRQGAGPRLALLEGRASLALPAAYVARVFDDYAPRFDQHLTQELGYRGPELIRDALEQIAPGRHFALALDLGCGSGLAGVALRDRIDQLVGVDLSAKMIAAAREKHVYDRLDVAELVAFLALEPEGAAELAFAADTLVYLGDLTPVFQAVARALRPEGLFVFTLESKPGEGYELGPGLRFRHAQTHVRACADAASLRLRIDVVANARREAGADAPGLLFALERAR